MSREPRMLLVPSLRRGGGVGHLVRCLRLLDELAPSAALLVPEQSSPGAWSRADVAAMFARRFEAGQVVDGPDEGDFDVVLVDRRATDVKEFLRFAAGRPTIGLDEGGPARELCTCLIDTFPCLDRGLPANIRDEGLVAAAAPQESVSDRAHAGIESMLLVFGGEDKADLSGKTFRALTRGAGVPAERISIVAGPARRGIPLAPGARVLDPDPHIRDRFKDFDLVISSFGLTPYEAYRRSVPVLLVDPSPYHHALSRAAGFPTAGTGRPCPRELRRALSRPEKLLRAPMLKKRLSHASLSELIRKFDFSACRGCPFCAERGGPVMIRLPERTFRRCSGCAMMYQERFDGEEMRYDEDYFFSDYHAQYGRTYLEDFDHIRDLGRSRMKTMQGLIGTRERPSVLDIGCAYGPFLSAAAEAGWRAFGVDISPEAVAHVRGTLGLPAAVGAFPDFDAEAVLGEGRFDAVSLWYVIEHFRDLDAVLAKLRSLVVDGGILALATPNGAGGSARSNLKRFLAESPSDHYSVWTPASAKVLLARHAFRVVTTRVTGHHPERLPGLRHCGRRAGMIASRLFGLGDTFEVYAMKEERP